MVNVEKHRKEKAETKLSVEELSVIETKIIGFLTINTDVVLKELEMVKKRYRKIIKKLVADKGAFISSEGCSKLMNNIVKTDFTLETIKLYYYAITIPSKKLEEVVTSLEETFKLLMKIKRLQNRNLDNANYFGLGSAVITEVFSGKAKNISDYTSAEEYEDLLRLNITYKTVNPEFTEKSSISL